MLCVLLIPSTPVQGLRPRTFRYRSHCTRPLSGDQSEMSIGPVRPVVDGHICSRWWSWIDVKIRSEPAKANLEFPRRAIIHRNFWMLLKVQSKVLECATDQ